MWASKWKSRQYRGRTYLPCPKCHTWLTHEEATVDHIKPASRGGTNAPSNFRILCRDCNQKKGCKW